MNFIPYIITAASIVGTVANSLQKRWCFYVWLCTNAFWCIFNAVNESYAQALLYAFNFAMAILGLIKWRRNEIHRKCSREILDKDLNFPKTDRYNAQLISIDEHEDLHKSGVRLEESKYKIVAMHKPPIICKVKRCLFGFSPSLMYCKCALGLRPREKKCNGCSENIPEIIYDSFKKGYEEEQRRTKWITKQ